MADTSTELKVIELDPDVWLRGGTGGGYLLKSIDGKRRQCCIGIACSAMGLPDEAIDGRGMVEEIDPVIKMPAVFAGLYRDDDDLRYDQLSRVYWENDSNSDDITDEDRVRNINATLETLGAKFRFALKAS